MIYTSYFAKRGIPDDVFKVSIARYSDRFPDIPRYEKLMPSTKLLFLMKKGIYNQFQYTRDFNTYLNSLDPEVVFDELHKLSGGKDIVLLCYETPDKFCHRQLVSKWLTNNCIRCQEYGEPELSDSEWIKKFGITDGEFNKDTNFYCAKR